MGLAIANRNRAADEVANLALQVRVQRIKARRHLLDFAVYVQPDFFPSRFHAHLGRILEAAVDGTGPRRIVVHAPPQHGKTRFVSTLFPAWYRGNHPDDPILLIAYGDEHAWDISRKTRGIISLPRYQMLFPSVKISPDNRSVGHWEVAPPHSGEFHAAGINGVVTGKGAKLLDLDDPIKNREEAENKGLREKAIESYKSTLSTRLHENAIEICMMTRWHQGDLAGWLLEHSGRGFVYYDFSALAVENDIMSRAVGEPLFPERYSLEWLMEQKATIGSYDWESMYQGAPMAPEGSLFRREYFHVIPKAPEHLEWVRYWDLATSTKTSADFTAGIAMAKDGEGNVYLRDMIRGRWEWPDVRKKLKVTALSNMRNGKDRQLEYPEVFWGIESAGTQKGMVQEIWQDPDLAGLGITGIPVSTDKRIRALPVVARGEAGRLYLEAGPWNDEYIEEMIRFDHGEHDDQVDTTSGGMAMLNMTTGGIDSWNETTA